MWAGVRATDSERKWSEIKKSQELINHDNEDRDGCPR